MIVMDTELRKAISEGNMVSRMDMTLADGTSLTLTGDDLMLGGITFTNSTSSASSFDVGAAIMPRCDVRLRNENRQWNGYDFDNAMFVAYVGASVDGTTQWIQRGVYWVEPIRTMGEIISMTGLGNMRLLELPYSEVKTAYPATLRKIVADVCSHCGITLLTDKFPHYDYTVNARLADSNASCAEVVGWAAQVAGCFVDEDEQGRLRIRWYNTGAWDSEGDLDGGTFDTDTTPYSDGDAANGGGFMTGGNNYDGGQFARAEYVGITEIRSLTAYVNDVNVTGVSVVAHDEQTKSGALGNAGEQVLNGTDGYVLDVADNPLIEYGRASEVAANIAENAVGMTFRPLTVRTLSDPAIEAGDAIQVTDRLQATYTAYATTVSFSTGGSVGVSCNAKSTSGYSQRERRTVQQQQSQVQQERVREASQVSVADYKSAIKDLLLNDPEFMGDLASELSDYGYEANYGSLEDADGNYYSLGIDENGNVVATKIPSAIEVVTDPTDTEYAVGEFINYDGISVRLLDGEGNVFTDDDYSDGLIPYDELIFPATTALYPSGVTRENATSVSVTSGPSLSGWSYPIELHSRLYTYDHADNVDIEYTRELTVLDGAAMVILQNDSDGYEFICARETSGAAVKTTRTVKNNDTGTTSVTESYTVASNAYTYDGRTVYYVISIVGSTADEYEPEISTTGPGSPLLAWAMVYGSVALSGDVQVPVQWRSPYDGRTLETTTQITVLPAEAATSGWTSMGDGYSGSGGGDF